MNNKFSKILTAIALVLAIITAFFYIRLLYIGDDELKASADFQNSIISPFIWFTVIVLIATIAISIFSSVFSLVRKPEQLKKSLLSIGILAVVLLIAYFFKDGTEVLGADGKVLVGGEENSTSNVWSSTGILYSIILGGVGLALFLVDMVKSLVKS